MIMQKIQIVILAVYHGIFQNVKNGKIPKIQDLRGRRHFRKSGCG